MDTYCKVTVDNESLLWLTSLMEPNKYEGKSHLWWKCAGHTTSHCPGGIEVMSQGSGDVRLVHAGVGERWKECGGPGGANICAGLHTHWLYCQPYTKKQLPGLTCVQTIIFPLLLLGVNYLCETTLRGIVVPKSYNFNVIQTNLMHCVQSNTT